MNEENLKFINYCVSLLTLANNYAKYIDDVKLTSTKLTFTTVEELELAKEENNV